MARPKKQKHVPAVLTVELLACPFCGTVPTTRPWHGGGPDKTMIHCDSDDCQVSPQVTGETPDEAAAKWNTREK
jgi:hypothetical protein